MNIIDKATQQAFEDIINKTIIPEYPCRRCTTGYSLSQFDYCGRCIKELIDDEEG